MMKNKKIYKPGQLLTINGKVYRIKRAKRYEKEFPRSFEWETCYMCDVYNECLRSGTDTILCKGIPSNCYLQLVIPKYSSSDEE
jgi:hypothetical protein